MIRRPLWIFALLALVAWGCEDCDEDGDDQASGAGESEQVTSRLGEAERAPSEATPRPEKLESVERSPREGVEKLRSSVEEALANTMKQMGEAMQVGLAAETGDDPCERAFTGLSAMVKHLAENASDSNRDVRPPNRDEFLKVCGGLGEDMQRCMGLGYGMQHQEECQKVYESQPPEVIQRLQTVTMSGQP